MEYINQLLKTNNGNNSKTFTQYFQDNLDPKFSTNYEVKRIGVPVNMIPGAMIQFFGNGNIVSKLN